MYRLINIILETYEAYDTLHDIVEYVAGMTIGIAFKSDFELKDLLEPFFRGH